MQALDASHKIQKYVQGIVYNGAAKNHIVIFYTGAHQSMIGIGVCETIKRHDSWIYSQSVDVGGSSKGGRRLQLVGARVMVILFLGGKSYLVIVRQDF